MEYTYIYILYILVLEDEKWRDNEIGYCTFTRIYPNALRWEYGIYLLLIANGESQYSAETYCHEIHWGVYIYMYKCVHEISYVPQCAQYSYHLL